MRTTSVRVRACNLSSGHGRRCTSTSARPAPGATAESCRAPRGSPPGLAARVPTDDRVLPGAATPGRRDEAVGAQGALSAGDSPREGTRSCPRVDAVATRTAPLRRTEAETHFENLPQKWRIFRRDTMVPVDYVRCLCSRGRKHRIMPRSSWRLPA